MNDNLAMSKSQMSKKVFDSLKSKLAKYSNKHSLSILRGVYKLPDS